MQTPTQTQSAAVARIASQNRIQIRLQNGDLFHIEGFPGLKLQADGESLSADQLKSAAGPCGRIVDQATRALNIFLTRAQEVHRNADLSTHGKANALAGPQRELLQGLAYMYDSLCSVRDATLADEAEMYRPPAAATAQAAALDIEVRTWWRAMNDADRATELQRLFRTPEGHDVLAALMRSPIPASAAEKSPIVEAWQAGQRSINPDRALAIDTSKEATDWALNALRMIAAVALNIAGLQTQDALARILPEADKELERGALAFGTPEQLARAKLLLKAGQSAYA